MRFVVLGAGAVGGVIGGLLHHHGHDVVLVARGRHLDVVARSGLRLETPDGVWEAMVPAVASPADVVWRRGDIALSCVKSQDSDAMLDALVNAGAPRDLPVFCVQNGVENERRTLRRFARTYAVCVMLPAVHLEPGVVLGFGSPSAGILDVGRYPEGIDETAVEVSAVLAGSGFVSDAVADVMRRKYAKLLTNLANAVEAACGPEARTSAVAVAAREEGRQVLTSAGIPFASDDEDQARRADHFRVRPVEGRRRGGGSTWQSLARGSASVETDHLNGEIVLLGRLHGVATPVNAGIQVVMRELARSRAAPGTMSLDELEARVGM